MDKETVEMVKGHWRSRAGRVGHGRKSVGTVGRLQCEIGRSLWAFLKSLGLSKDLQDFRELRKWILVRRPFLKRGGQCKGPEAGVYQVELKKSTKAIREWE